MQGSGPGRGVARGWRLRPALWSCCCSAALLVCSGAQRGWRPCQGARFQPRTPWVTPAWRGPRRRPAASPPELQAPPAEGEAARGPASRGSRADGRVPWRGLTGGGDAGEALPAGALRRHPAAPRRLAARPPRRRQADWATPSGVVCGTRSKTGGGGESGCHRAREDASAAAGCESRLCPEQDVSSEMWVKRNLKTNKKVPTFLRSPKRNGDQGQEDRKAGSSLSS
ncbi:uncharacterized protein AAES06_020578 [Glossophaga mutica]